MVVQIKVKKLHLTCSVVSKKYVEIQVHKPQFMQLMLFLNNNNNKKYKV